MYRDGGGGATVNGHNLMTFADTYTTDGGINGTWLTFISNTYSYADTNLSDPAYVRNFGSNGIPSLAVPMLANETYPGPNGRYCIWPSNSQVAYSLGGQNFAVGVFPVITNLIGGYIAFNYNTLVGITFTPTGPVTTRLVQSLFYYGEITYGSFGLYAGPDGYTYLFAEDTTGVKAARAPSLPVTAIKDRTQYSYYNAGQWAQQIPDITDTSYNIFNYTANYFGVIVGPSSGEIFFSPYHNTTIIVFFDGFVDGIFQISYSTSGTLYGPWTTPQVLYQPPWPPQYWNYAGHAYPQIDPSGRTLTLRYTYGGNFINVAKITWCDPYNPDCGSVVESGFYWNATESTSFMATTTSSSSSSSLSSLPPSMSVSPSDSSASLPSTTTTTVLSTPTAVSSGQVSTISTPAATTAAAAPQRRDYSLVKGKLPKAKTNPLSVERWKALNGVCKLKYSGCNVIPLKIEADSNNVVSAKVLGTDIRPVGVYWQSLNGTF